MRDGWVETSLVNVFESCKNGKNYKEDENQRGLPITRIQTIADGTINLQKVGFGNLEEVDCLDFLLREGDILFSHINSLPHVGKVAYVTDEHIPLVHGMNLLRMRFKSSCDSKFMFYLMQHLDMREKVRSIAQIAVNQVSVNITNLKLLPILLPQLSEQKRIADLISSVDSYIEALQQQLESAKRSRNAVLHELLTAGGDDWVETTLDRVTECSWGNTETTKSKYVESGFLAYSASGADGFLDWFEHDRTAVVLSAIGAQCGKTWFAEGKWTSIKNTIWLKSDNSNLLDKYLFYLSNTDQFWQIRGQAQPFISLGDVKKTRVLLPPLREQERIVEVISEMDAFIESIQRTSMEAKNLRSGLLSDLLSGSHEIPTIYDKVMGAA
jgi:type I restriction enzyme S subunit